ncbi:hypothetical protein ABH926_004683 [Catenulispora sp. GP43]|uniref:hypothetical protein n=1 Tax=Catenulispora sp. GP43 TaxID=3156263 RepID=UPI003512666E
MRTTGNSPRALGRRRPGRRAAEELLDHTGGAGAAGVVSGEAAPAGSQPAGPGFEPGPDLRALSRLLDAAAGPALAAELSGEDAARAAFSAHHSVAAHHSVSATPTKERRVFSKALLAKTLTVKIAVAVCGVSVVGASAAAATNSLPSGLQSKAHSLGFPAPKPAAIHNDLLSGTQHDSDSPHPGTPTPTGSSAKPAAAHDDQTALDAAGAKLLGDDGFRLCKAVEDGDRDDQGHDLTAADLQKLAKAANVPAADIAKLESRLDAERSQAQKRMQDFCDRLAQAEKDAREGHVPTFPIPTPHPGDGWPTTWPTQLPTIPGLPTHLPTGLPTHLPTVPPSRLPTGLPTSIPTGWPTGWPIDGGPQNPVDPIHPGVPTASGSGVGQH